MLSSPWTLERPHPFIYSRPLGLTEEVFYWDARFEGTADSLQSAEIQVKHGAVESTVSPANIERAWMALKYRFPLLGAQVSRRENQSLRFVVSEERLRSCGPGEVQFHHVASPEEADTVTSNILNSPRLLSDDLLACLLVFRRTDTSRRLNISIHVAHSVSDGIAGATLLRTFLDQLASFSFAVDMWDIRERLALSSCSEDLFPAHRLSVARRRWRRAIAAAISAGRASKLRGGHTLPNKITNLIPSQPARSCNILASFTAEESQAIIESCRRAGMTFGVVYPILGQVALTRVLCRRFSRGEISQDEWEFRKREPMITAGPLNLRPYLDQEWYNKGGATNVNVAIGFYFYHLPFMPLGAAANMVPGDPEPPFSDLLSKKRLLYRAGLIKNQADRVIRHPLRCEINAARLPARIQFGKEVAQNWESKALFHNAINCRLLSAQEQASQGMVLSHGGSSFGSTDGLYPVLYPLSGATPVLQLVATRVLLRCRPKELYLGAASGRGQLRINVFFDGNSYDPELVQELLDEVKSAALHYLLPEKLVLSRL